MIKPPETNNPEKSSDSEKGSQEDGMESVESTEESSANEEFQSMFVENGTIKVVGIKNGKNRGCFERVRSLNLLNFRIFSVCLATSCCTLLCFVLSVFLGLLFFLVFHFSEVDEYGDKIERKRIEKSDLFDLKLGGLHTSASSIYSFYEGSSFVDYGEFETFCEPFTDDDLILFLEWIVLVPQKKVDDFNFTETVSNLKLPTELEDEYSGTIFDDSLENHYLVSYVQPLSEDDLEDSILSTNFGDDLAKDTRVSVIERVLDSGNEEYYYANNEDEENFLELYIPVIKSSLEESLGPPKDNQNGVIRGIFRFDQLISDVFSDEETNYYVKVNNEFIGVSDKEEATGSFQQTVSKTLPGGLVIDIELESKSGFEDSPFLPLKWIFLFFPFFFCCFFYMLNSGVCLCCRSWIKTKNQNNVIRSVVEAIVTMNFHSQVVRKIEKTRAGKKTTVGMMKKLIKQVKLYRKFLPQTMLAQIDEQHNMSESESASASVSNHSKSSKDNIVPMKPRSRESYTTDSTGSLNIDNESDNSSHNKKDLADKSFLGNFSEREVVVMEVSIDQIEPLFKRGFNFKKTHLIRRMYVSFNELLFRIVRSHRGDFHRFTPRGTLFSWGAVRRRVSCETDACSAALAIINNPFFSKNRITPRVSICKGVSYMGNFELRLGEDESSIRQFDMIGFPSFYCSLMNRMCRKYGSQILIDAEMQKSVKFDTELNVVDYVRFGNNKPQKIYELTKVSEKREDEWFYELDQMNKSNPSKEICARIEKCWDYLIQNKRSKAREEMMDILKEGTEKEREEASEKMKRFSRVYEYVTTKLHEEEKYEKICLF